MVPPARLKGIPTRAAGRLERILEAARAPAGAGIADRGRGDQSPADDNFNTLVMMPRGILNTPCEIQPTSENKGPPALRNIPVVSAKKKALENSNLADPAKLPGGYW